MPAPVSLTKVNIAPSRYYSIIDGVKTEITEEQYNSPPAENETRSVCIAFDTPTGQLSDGQFAIQKNGFCWVKAPGYKVIKLRPVFVKNNTLTAQGIAETIKKSEVE